MNWELIYLIGGLVFIALFLIWMLSTSGGGDRPDRVDRWVPA